jgi:hypothetical protein
MKFSEFSSLKRNRIENKNKLKSKEAKPSTHIPLISWVYLLPTENVPSVLPVGPW